MACRTPVDRDGLARDNENTDQIPTALAWENVDIRSVSQRQSTLNVKNLYNILDKSIFSCNYNNTMILFCKC